MQQSVQMITSSKELKKRIQYLEQRTHEQEMRLKEQWRETYESFKPQNLLRNIVTDVAATPNIKNNLLNASVGLLTGILTRRLIAGPSAGIVKRLAATAVQLGVTKAVANNFTNIKDKVQRLFSKKHSHNGKLH
ncbi:MAG TPA: hypothetical protein VJ647_00240 [Chitinophagaceae bacterium]|nr:hypothetical protein [Chitinophagaceae bacterium]